MIATNTAISIDREVRSGKFNKTCRGTTDAYLDANMPSATVLSVGNSVLTISALRHDHRQFANCISVWSKS